MGPVPNSGDPHMAGPKQLYLVHMVRILLTVNSPSLPVQIDTTCQLAYANNKHNTSTTLPVSALPLASSCA